MEIFYVTGNEGKFLEAKGIVPQFKRLSIDLDEIQSIDSNEITRKKANEAYKISHAENLVVDDVSLYLEALDYKLPGPFVKWFLTSIGTSGIFDIANASKKYGAKVVCTLCYRNKSGSLKIFSGSVSGKIVKPRPKSFKSWDGIFMPDGKNITFADMSLSEKNKISHRGIAMRKLRKYLIS